MLSREKRVQRYANYLNYANNSVLFFYLEGKRADQVAVGEEIGIVVAGFRCFADRPIDGSEELFAGVLESLRHGVGNVAIFERKEFGGVFSEEIAIGVDESDVEGFHTRVAGDVFADGIIELQFAYLTDDARFAVVFVERGKVARRQLKQRGAPDGFCQLGVGLSELLVVLLQLPIVLLILLIFRGESLVRGIERVDLAHVFDHDGADGGEFFFEFGNTSCIGGFGDAQLFQEVLDALLLAGEQVLERVVLDANVLVTIELDGQVFVLLLQFGFFVFHKFDHFVHLLPLLEEEKKERCNAQNEHNDDWNDYFFIHKCYGCFNRGCKGTAFFRDVQERRYFFMRGFYGRIIGKSK